MNKREIYNELESCLWDEIAQWVMATSFGDSQRDAIADAFDYLVTEISDHLDETELSVIEMAEMIMSDSYGEDDGTGDDQELDRLESEYEDHQAKIKEDWAKLDEATFMHTIGRI